MSPPRFFKLSLLISSVMVFVFCPLSWGMAKNYVSDIRFGKHASFDRVVVNLNQKPHYRVFNFKRPERLVVDIYDSVLPRVHQRKNVRGERIIRIRASQFNNRTVRVVLDLKKGNPQHIFCLPPHGDSPYRLIIDVKSEALPDRNIEPSLSPTKEKEIAVMPDSGKEESASVMQKETLPLKTFRINGFFLARGAVDTDKETGTEHRRLFRNKVRLEGKWSPRKSSTYTPNRKDGKFYALASLESDYLWFGHDHSAEDYDLDLFEGYLYWSRRPVEIRLGKQIVRWGKTDQISPVDNINSQDFREFIVPDLEDRKIPNWMARVRLFPGACALEGVYIPFFEPSRIDYFGSDWATYRHAKDDIRDSGLPPDLKRYLLGISVNEKEPARNFKNGQWGARISRTISDWDLGLNYLYAWESLPYYKSFPAKNLDVGGSFSSQNLLKALDGMSLTDEDIEITYERSHIFGLEFETTIRDIGFRGEAACFDRQSFLTNSLTSTRKPVFFYVLGADYLGEDNWYVNFQFAHQIISDYTPDILYFQRNNTSLNGEIRKEFLRGNLQAVLWYNFSLSDNGYYLRPKIICKYIPRLDITFGFNIFGGDDDTLMGYYDDNDQVFLSLKFYM